MPTVRGRRRIPVVLVSGIGSILSRTSHPSGSRLWGDPLEDRLQPLARRAPDNRQFPAVSTV